MPTFFVMYDKESSCSYHRIFNPFLNLKSEDGDNFRFMEKSIMVTESKLKGSDLVVFNRIPHMALDNLELYKKKFGYKILVDVDDFWEVYDEHYLKKAWVQTNMKRLILRAVKMADMVTVTNSRLADEVMNHNKNVEILPNALPLNTRQFIPDKIESNKVRFLFSGGVSHLKDYESIKDYFLWCSLSEPINNKAQFILAGYNPTNDGSEWHKIKEMMRKLPNLETRGELSIEKYMEHYNYADVVMAPLLRNKFNTCKSNLKTIEAGCMRLPIICTEMYPYLEDEKMKSRGVHFCEKDSDWLKWTQFFIKNQKAIIDFGENLHQHVAENYDLAKVNLKRRQILNYLTQ
jgi:hypothetical protein